jgi:hypothetical protein
VLQVNRNDDTYEQELRELALQFLPDDRMDAEARRADEERRSAERTARVLAMRETADAVLGGRYGKEAKAAAEHALKAGRTEEALLTVSRIAAEARKRGAMPRKVAR